MDTKNSVKSVSDNEQEEQVEKEEEEDHEEDAAQAKGESRNTTSRKIAELPEKLAETISQGDLCIAFFTPFHQKLFTVEGSGVFDTKYGHYNYSDIIGKQFGSMVS